MLPLPNLQFPKREIHDRTSRSASIDERQSVDMPMRRRNFRLTLQYPFPATGKKGRNREANMHETHDDHLQAIPNHHLIPQQQHGIH